MRIILSSALSALCFVLPVVTAQGAPGDPRPADPRPADPRPADPRPAETGSASAVAPSSSPVPAMPTTPGRVVLLPVVVKPILASSVVERFRKAMETGMGLAAMIVVDRDDTEEERLRSVGSCRTPACYKTLVTALKASFLFATTVERTGKNYRLRCEVYDPTGRISFKQAAGCDICTLSEAVTRAQQLGQDAGTQLLTKYRALLPRPRPRPRVRPRPRPRPVPKPVPKVKPKPTPGQLMVQAAWMSGVGGVLSTVAGVTLLALDKRPTCDSAQPERMCPYRYRTGAAGAVFTALGGASMVASALLFYYGYSYKRKKTEKPRATVGVAPTRGGVWAHASFRF